jgi:predicted nucleotide-binding protein
VVCVVITPDDVGAAATDSDDLKRRGRQNVIFELGYFLGQLGRKSGCVLLLHHGPLELPSDLAGVIYIDISNGIDSAAEQIRLELENVR